MSVVVRAGLVVGALVFGTDDLEVLVELHVDLAAVAEGDLDLVLAFLVVDLGLGDSAFADVYADKVIEALGVLPTP